MNTRTNIKFLNLAVGKLIQVQPGLYKGEWRDAEVLGTTHTDVRTQPFSLNEHCRRYELQVKLLDCDYITWILDEKNIREINSCEFCNGERGGVKGNENVVDGKLMCDYCHSDKIC